MYSYGIEPIGSDMEAIQGMLAGVVGATFITFYIAAIVIGIIMIIAAWKIYDKAGKPGWASLIPVYTNIVQFQIIGLNPWLLLLYLVPVVNVFAAIVFGIMIPFRMAKSFGQGVAFGFGLLLLGPIFNLILAFGSSEYVGPNGETTEE